MASQVASRGKHRNLLAQVRLLPHRRGCRLDRHLRHLPHLQQDGTGDAAESKAGIHIMKVIFLRR